MHEICSRFYHKLNILRQFKISPSSGLTLSTIYAWFLCYWQFELSLPSPKKVAVINYSV